LLIAALFAVASAWLASGLEIRSSFEELLPTNVPSVAQVKELIRRVGGDGTVLVNVEMLDPLEGLTVAEAIAEKLAKEYLAFGPSVIRTVEWNMRPIEAWYADHWPLFASLEDLQKARDTLKSEIAKAKARANPLLLHLEDEEPKPLDAAPEALPWLDPNRPLPRQEIEERFARYPNGFLVAPDGWSVTILVRPTGTALGVAEARALLNRMRQVADSHADELREHHLRVGFGGTFPLFVAEYEAIINDVASTAMVVLSVVLATLFLFFRELRSTLALGVAITVAVAITFGLTRLVIGYLNTQTAFLGSIVVGNGINYGLIYLTRVRQLRRAGIGLEEACVEGAQTSANATLLASAASSVSFGVLMLAANRGFRHFGFIGGIGMLLCWIFTFALVPALLETFERLRPARYQTVGPSVRWEVPRWLQSAFARPKAIVAAFAILAVASLALFLRHLPDALERNLNNLTNDLSRERQLINDNNRAQSALGRSVSGAIALLPSWPAADEFCAVIRQRQALPRYSPLIEGCDTLSSVVPRQQPEKLSLIREIVKLISDFVLEKLPPERGRRLRQVREELASQREVSVEQAPPQLSDRFRERDGTLGRIAAVTARPNAKLELGPNLSAFVEAVRKVPVQGQLYDAAGENVVFADLLEDIQREGPKATMLSFLGVCVLVVLFFRSARASILVVGALTTGVLLMGGVTALLRLKINFFNFIVYPITFGIAVDYGANVVDRIRERGGQVLPSLWEVGPAVALCSWTSIVGYSSLLLSINRALRSFGWYGIIGEVTSIVSALVLLPALRMLVPARVFTRTEERSF
jgi:predicted RND superfamily exporter protein